MRSISKAKRTIRNQSGLGLVPVIITALVVSLVIAGMFTSLMSLSGARVSRSLTIKGELLGDQLRAVLSSENACRNTLATQALPAAGVTTDLVKSIRVGANVESFAAGSVVEEDLEIVRFQIETDTAFAPTTLLSAGGEINQRVNLVFQVRKQGQGIFAPLSDAIRIPIQVNQVAGAIVSCAAENPEILACMELGGVWNSSGNLGERCVPNNYCQFGGSFSMAPNTEGGFGNFYATPAFSKQCPAGFTQQTSGSITRAYYSGKSLRQTSYPVITCQKCNRPLPTVTTGVGNLDSLFDDINNAVTEADTLGTPYFNGINGIYTNVGTISCTYGMAYTNGTLCNKSNTWPRYYYYDLDGDPMTPDNLETCMCN